MKQELYITKALEWFDIWAKDFIDSTSYHGFSISFAKEDKILFSKTYSGNEDIELFDDNLFRMASQSKNITAIAIMQLCEQGKLSLDDKIIKYLDFLNKDDKGYKNITIKQVMSHSAGIKRDSDNEIYWSALEPFPNKNHLVNFFKTSKTYIINNAEFQYSNYGYALLGLLIEEITGQQYNEYIQNNIFKNIDNIYIDSDFVPNKAKIAKGYTSKSVTGNYEVLTTDQSTNILSSAAGLVASTKAMCDFYQKLYYKNESLISDSSKTELFNPIVSNNSNNIDYGLGFRNIKYKGFTQIGHIGVFPGCISATAFDPTNQIVISCACNDCYGVPIDIINTFIDFIEFFKEHKNDLLAQDNYDFRKVILNLYYSCLFIPIKDKIYVMSSNEAYPFYKCERFDKSSTENLYKITNNKNDDCFFGNEIVVKFDKNKIIKSVNYSGANMIRKEDFIIKK